MAYAFGAHEFWDEEHEHEEKRGLVGQGEAPVLGFHIVSSHIVDIAVLDDQNDLPDQIL